MDVLLTASSAFLPDNAQTIWNIVVIALLLALIVIWRPFRQRYKNVGGIIVAALLGAIAGLLLRKLNLVLAASVLGYGGSGVDRLHGRGHCWLHPYNIVRKCRYVTLSVSVCLLFHLDARMVGTFRTRIATLLNGTDVAHRGAVFSSAEEGGQSDKPHDSGR